MRPVKRVRVQPRPGPSYIAGNPQRRRSARAANRSGPSAWMRSANARVIELVHHSRAGSVRSASGYQPKLDIAEQCRLNFGRHRSGLKYGLDYLFCLHDNNGTVFDAFLERTFSWHPGGPRPHSTPWVGIVHVPPGLPDWFHPEQSHEKLFGSQLWDASRPHCLGLYAFSNYHREFLQERLGIPVNTLFLPTETPWRKWSWRKFLANRDRKVVQIGWWARNLHAIYQLQASTFRKVFLDVEHPSIRVLMEKEKRVLLSRGAFSDKMYESVQTLGYVSDRDYDHLLSENVVFLSLYDASASNAVVECMARNTPILINPLPAIVEYLGREYPFYFTSLEEAAEKLTDLDLIRRAHTYLAVHPAKEKLTGTFFLKSMAESPIYRALPAGPGPR